MAGYKPQCIEKRNPLIRSEYSLKNSAAISNYYWKILKLKLAWKLSFCNGVMYMIKKERKQGKPENQDTKYECKPLKPHNIIGTSI